MPGSGITTHTGAALLTTGKRERPEFKGDCLTHQSASVYGYGTLERNGPKLLAAWQAVLGRLALPGA